ncbi:MAG: DUF1080 domain-containing protein [Acidobacteriota bacterium]
MRLLAALLISVALAPAQEWKRASKADWKPLFNGKNLDGWTPKINHYPLGENFGNTFRVENGVMKVGYEAYDRFDERFGHIFYKDKLSYYVIAAEYRFTGDQAKGGPGWAARNSGIMIHCQDPKTIGKDQDFPISIEVQLLGGLGKGPRSTANLCTPGTNVVYQGKLHTDHCTNSTSQTYNGDQWVRVEVEVNGDGWIRHYVNGEKVLEYEKPQVGGGAVNGYDPAAKPDGELLEGGWVSLQSESHPVEFRKVEMLPLRGCMDPKSKNFRPYYVKADNAQCAR